MSENEVEFKTISPACHTGAVKVPLVKGAYPKDWIKRQCDGCGDYAFCKKRLKSKLLRGE